MDAPDTVPEDKSKTDIVSDEVLTIPEEPKGIIKKRLAFSRIESIDLPGGDVAEAGREYHILPTYLKEPVLAEVQSFYWDPIGFPKTGKTCDDPLRCRARAVAVFCDDRDAVSHMKDKYRKFWLSEADYIMRRGVIKHNTDGVDLILPGGDED